MLWLPINILDAFSIFLYSLGRGGHLIFYQLSLLFFNCRNDTLWLWLILINNVKKDIIMYITTQNTFIYFSFHPIPAKWFLDSGHLSRSFVSVRLRMSLGLVESFQNASDNQTIKVSHMSQLSIWVKSRPAIALY